MIGNDTIVPDLNGVYFISVNRDHGIWELETMFFFWKTKYTKITSRTPKVLFNLTSVPGEIVSITDYENHEGKTPY